MASALKQRLRIWLDRQLENLTPGSQLPVDKEIAKALGISKRTVERVMAEYAAKGWVERIAGRGTFIAQSKKDADSVAIAQPSSSVKQLVNNIHALINSGEMKKGESLPSVKYLCRRFKVSPTTVSKAYAELRKGGFVTKIGKSFWVGAFQELAHPNIKKEVFLFLLDSDDFAQVFKDDTLSYSYRKMENELGAYGFVLRCENSKNLDPLIDSWIKSRLPPYGLIFHSMSEAAFRQIAPLVNKLASRKHITMPPVLVDWETGTIRESISRATFLMRPNITTTAARSLAHFLVEKKHQQAVIFSQKKALHGKRMWKYYDQLRLRAELKELNKDFKYQIVIETSKSGKEARDEFFKELISGVGERILSKYHPVPWSQACKETAFTDDLSKAYAKYKKGKVWIFVNDDVAAQAIAWAKEKRIRIPQDLAIIGLENNPSYYHLGITRCEPDWESVGYLMAHSIIGDITVPKSHRGFIKAGMRVIEKMTT